MFALMFFIFSKLLDFALSPLSWVLLFALLALRQKPRSRRWFIASLTLLLLTTNPFLTQLAMRSWEVTFYPAEKISGKYPVGILLGGSINFYDPELKKPVYSQSVDRLFQTIHLYKTGKIEKILISGGSGLLLARDFSESDVTRSVLLEVGVAEEDIIIENKSRNTHENAVETGKILDSLGITQPALIITSGYHMRRSLACFYKAGVPVHPFPADRKTSEFRFTPDRTVIPDASCLVMWKIMIKEWIGILVYKIQGYA